MLKERVSFVKTMVYFFEIILISIAFFIVYYLTRHLHQIYPLDILPGSELLKRPGSLRLYRRVFLCAFFIWAVLLYRRSPYQHLRVQTYAKLFTHHVINGLIFFGVMTSASFILKFHFLSRMFIGLYTAFSVLFLVLNQAVILTIAYYVRKKGYNYRNILVVGTGRRTVQFLGLLKRHHEWGYRIVGLLDRDKEKVGQMIDGHPVIGTLEELPKLLGVRGHVVDEVVFVVPRNWLHEIEKSILYCEAVGVPATLSTDFFDLEIASGVPKEMEGYTYLTFETRLLKESELFVKRIFDIVFSSIVLVLGSPLFLILSLLVKSSSKGPIFFKQVRCGRNRRKFVLYKFRSMDDGAEARLDEVKALNEMSGPVFKATDDPRVTKVGKFLRKTSLDEIPQFWNVLMGDMSLVGPRPPLPDEVEKYEPWQQRRLSMKPGITCIWQVSGRNHIDFDEWMKLDLQYIDRWSLWLDIKIVLLTVKAVLLRHGAR